MESDSLIRKLECPVCGREVPELTYEIEEELRDKIVSAIQKNKPEWTQKSGVCELCLNYFRNLVTRPSRFRMLKDKVQSMIGRQHHPDS